jgi:uncharacterized membrane protein YdjX (TVP38/TMEM64 family)
MTARRLLVVLAIAVLVALFYAFRLDRYLSLEYFRSQQTDIAAYYSIHPFRTAAIYFAIYVIATGLSLPGAATIMTLVGGAIFGLLWGVVIVSFSSTLGATLAFLVSRFLLHDWVRQKFGRRLKPVYDGVAREGAFYLFALRLVPAVPFVAVNLAMGLTPIRTWTFVWVSQLSMLAGTIVYVYTGTQLGRFEVSIGLLVAFAALGTLPARCQEEPRCGQGAQGIRALATPGTLRSQCRRDRRRFRRPRFRLHRRGDKGQGDAGRTAPDGRRLPLHRLHTFQGAHPVGAIPGASAAFGRARESGPRPRSSISPRSWSACSASSGRWSPTIPWSAIRAWESNA